MTAFICPICQAPLQPSPQGFGCSERHQFDKAKEGYVNLLPVQQKKSKNPGDDPKMVQARRAFLAAGHYQFLQQKLIASICEVIEENTHLPIKTIVDSGCGEGYYTNGLSHHLGNYLGNHLCEVYGIDIAKTAVRYAAKRAPKERGANTQYAVASSHALPFATKSVDILYKVFAPMAEDEVQRVLNPQGYFISVVPGPNHLLQLRERIYSQVNPHQSEPTPQGFTRLNTKNEQKRIILDKSEEIQYLCEMTPFAWKLSKQVQNELFNSQKLTMDFDFTINIYQPISAE